MVVVLLCISSSSSNLRREIGAGAGKWAEALQLQAGADIAVQNATIPQNSQGNKSIEINKLL